MTAHQPRSTAARVVLVLSVLSLVAYFVAIMSFRLRNGASEWSIDGDQQQSIGQFWRYSVDGAIPPGNLITDYAFAYHSPPLWWLVMAVLSTFSTPVFAAKLTAAAAYGLTAFGAFLVVGKRTSWVLGCFVGMLALRNPNMPEQVTGGMARAFGPALVCLFLYAFMQRRHNLVLLLLVIQAGTYPSVVIPCGIFYGLYCVLAGPGRERLRRCSKLFVVGLVIILLGKAQDFRSPAWWGSVVTYEEANAMPAWHHGGRFEELPHRPFVPLVKNNLIRAHTLLGHTAAPKAAVDFVNRSMHETLLVTPMALAFLALLIAGVRRWRVLYRTGVAEAEPIETRFPWEVFGLFICALIGWGLVQLVAFKLFLPARQLAHTVQFLVLVGLPLVVWHGAARLFRRRWAALTLATLLTVVPVFVLRGDGLAPARLGYKNYGVDFKAFNAIRKLPLDKEVACDMYYCEMMIVFGQHAPFAAKNLTHPLRAGYYKEAERRLVRMLRLLYATTAAELQSFVDEEHVTAFVYSPVSVGRVDPRLFNPMKAQVVSTFNSTKNTPRLLQNPPPEAIIYRDERSVIVDLAKFATWAAEQERRKAATPVDEPAIAPPATP